MIFIYIYRRRGEAKLFGYTCKWTVHKKGSSQRTRLPHYCLLFYVQFSLLHYKVVLCSSRDIHFWFLSCVFAKHSKERWWRSSSSQKKKRLRKGEEEEQKRICKSFSSALIHEHFTCIYISSFFSRIKNRSGQ